MPDENDPLAGDRRWRRPTLVEWLVVIAVIAILVSLIVPGSKWASSGSITFPVRVFVFDAAHARPIQEAQIAVVNGPHPRAGLNIDDIRERIPDDIFERLPAEDVGVTGDDGAAVVLYEFSTGASHNRPETHAHLESAWVVVAAEGYATVVIPIRHDSMPIEKLREHEELFVPIGLGRPAVR